MAIRRCAGGMSVTSTPSMKHWPSVIASSPAIIRSSVDLPQPEGPSSAVNEPFDQRLRSLIAVTRRSAWSRASVRHAPSALFRFWSPRRSSLDTRRQGDGLGHPPLEEQIGGRHRQAGQDRASQKARIGTPNVSCTARMPTVTVIIVSSLAARKGQRKLFQAPMNVTMPSAW